MTEESRVSRTPRTWTEADIVDWPKDHPDLKDRRGTTWRWWPAGDFYTTDWNEAASWRQLCEKLGPLVEVLPDAPEPQPERQSAPWPIAAVGKEPLEPLASEATMARARSVECRTEGHRTRPESSAGGSSVSSLSDDTTRADKPATGTLSLEEWCKLRAAELSTDGQPNAATNALWDVIDEIRRRSTRDVKVEVHVVPDTYNLSDWRAVVAVTHNGAYWPIAVAFPGRAEILRAALSIWANLHPDDLLNQIYKTTGGQGEPTIQDRSV